MPEYQTLLSPDQEASSQKTLNAGKKRQSNRILTGLKAWPHVFFMVIPVLVTTFFFLPEATVSAQNRNDPYYESIRKGAEAGEAYSQRMYGEYFRNNKDLKQAQFWFEKAAAQDSLGALTNIGNLYYTDKYGAQDIEKARYWFKKAADQGDSEALYHLGTIYLEGLGVPQDAVKALDFFEKANFGGIIGAPFSAGMIYYEGHKGVPQDYAKARYWFTKASESRTNKDAGYMLGNMYAEGLGVTKDIDKAIELYKSIATSRWGSGPSHSGAQFRLGLLYHEGKDVKHNSKAAKRWLKRSFVPAQFLLETAYPDMGNGLAKDPDKLVAWYGQAAYEDYLSALIGVVVDGGDDEDKDKTINYLEAYGHLIFLTKLAPNNKIYTILHSSFPHPLTPEETEKAQNFAAYLERSLEAAKTPRLVKVEAEETSKPSQFMLELQTKADQGDVEAQGKLGYFYAFGEGSLPVDSQKAVYWFEKAEDQGDFYSQTMLAEMYAKGEGLVKQDHKKAAYYFEQAAKRGDPVSQQALGELYYNGLGVAQDYSKAKEWIEKAAAGGNVEGQCLLGNMYHQGQGGPKDTMKAIAWYEQAAGQGYVAAQSRLGTMYDEGQEGLPKEPQKAVYWFEQAGQRGHSESLVYMIDALKNGAGTPTNLVNAYGYAIFLMSLEQRTTGFEEIRKALSPEQIKEAEKLAVQLWLKKAALGGNVEGQFMLANMYHQGQGVPKDLKKAVYWFELAAGQGYRDSLIYMIDASQNGTGTPKNLVNAYGYVLFLMSQDREQSETDFEEIRKALSSAQIKEAESFSNHLSMNYFLALKRKHLL